MIHTYDRSGYLGGSDAKFIVATNRNTKTWRNWWNVKLGLEDSSFKGNMYTRAGTRYEHSILKKVNAEMNLDRQIVIDDRRMLVRVNYDGDLLDGDMCDIYECKTHRSDKPFEITDYIWMQCQMQMFAWKQAEKNQDIPKLRDLYVVSYPLYPDEYYTEPPAEWVENGTIPIDEKRLKIQKVSYDRGFCNGVLKKNIKELSKEMRKKGLHNDNTQPVEGMLEDEGDGSPA